MGKLIRSMDWSKSSLGPIDTWPQSLRTTVSLCLASTFPINIVWGPKRVQMYNDGYWPICGSKHPHSMGQDFAKCWASAWPVIGEAFDRALAGQPAFLENQRMFLDRKGYLEEAFFTFSFSPIRDETGGVGGLFHPVTEVTTKLLGERRTLALRELADNTGKAKTVEEVLAQTARTLCDHDLDLPFVLLYLIDPSGTQANLSACCGLSAGTAASPEHIALDATQSTAWPLADIVGSGVGLQVDALDSRFCPLVCGPYPEPPKTALLLPITLPGLKQPVAIVVAGVSARLDLDASYRAFFGLVGSAISAAVANATAHEEQRRRAEALAEIDRAKTAFFSNVSHEFRTPLTLLLGPAADLLTGSHGELTAAQAEQVEFVHRSALRLQKLVNALLDFSRIEAGRMQAAYEPVDLCELTCDVASAFRAAVEKAGLALTISCPPLDQPIYVDRDMWEKIVLNLLSNAFKFTFEGGIDVSIYALDDSVALRIEDTGVGVPEAEVPRLFERFFRVEGTRARTHEGSGIGLALVHDLTKLHGGSVHAASRLGVGTTFTVTIPKGSAHLPQDRISAARPTSVLSRPAASPDAFVEETLRWLPRDTDRGPKPTGSKVTATVLLADDNADLRNYVRRLLEPHFIVEAVENGADALVAARACTPDLVLTDVMMPKVDGFELLKELRMDEATKLIPVVMLSAREGEEAKLEGLAAGAEDYLVKPFSARELVARVRMNIELARLRKEREHRIQELEQTVRLNEMLVGVLGHDLRNPLSAIAMAANLLSKRAESEAIAKPVSRIVSSSNRMSRMIDQLLDFTRIRLAQGIPIERQQMGLWGICRAVIDELSPTKDGIIRFEESGDLFGLWDRDRLLQLLSNLVANACQHRLPNTPVLLVADGTSPESVTIEVHNQGAIPADMLAVIFDPLHVGKGKTSGGSSGLGLGLHISQQIVFAHKGTIRAESSADYGTRFVVELPRATKNSTETDHPDA